MTDPAGSGPSVTAHAAHVEATREFALLLGADEVDAAIASGLMDWTPCAECACSDPVVAASGIVIANVQSRLRIAWSARERFRARADRLERRAMERASARAAVASPGTQRPALPSAAAAALARAKARAADKR